MKSQGKIRKPWKRIWQRSSDTEKGKPAKGKKTSQRTNDKQLDIFASAKELEKAVRRQTKIPIGDIHFIYWLTRKTAE